MTNYEITEIKAIAACAGETEAQDALLVHLTKDPHKDGDCILFGYSIDELETDEDVEEALQNNSPCSDFTEENGIYTAN